MRRSARPPVLVMRSIHANKLDQTELGAALRFKFGTANKSDYDLMLDLVNMMLIAGNTGKKRNYIANYADNVALPTLRSIQQRYMSTGKLGVSGDESKILVDITTHSKDFWNRQPGDLYNLCAKELKLFYESLRKPK